MNLEAYLVIRAILRDRPWAIALAVLSFMASAPVLGQGLKDQIVGTWLAVSQYVDQDGKRVLRTWSSCTRPTPRISHFSRARATIHIYPRPGVNTSQRDYGHPMRDA